MSRSSTVTPITMRTDMRATVIHESYLELLHDLMRELEGMPTPTTPWRAFATTCTGAEWGLRVVALDSSCIFVMHVSDSECTYLGTLEDWSLIICGDYLKSYMHIDTEDSEWKRLIEVWIPWMETALRRVVSSAPTSVAHLHRNWIRLSFGACAAHLQSPVSFTLRVGHRMVGDTTGWGVSLENPLVQVEWSCAPRSSDDEEWLWLRAQFQQYYARAHTMIQEWTTTHGTVHNMWRLMNACAGKPADVVKNMAKNALERHKRQAGQHDGLALRGVDVRTGWTAPPMREEWTLWQWLRVLAPRMMQPYWSGDVALEWNDEAGWRLLATMSRLWRLSQSKHARHDEQDVAVFESWTSGNETPSSTSKRRYQTLEFQKGPNHAELHAWSRHLVAVHVEHQDVEGQRRWGALQCVSTTKVDVKQADESDERGAGGGGEEEKEGEDDEEKEDDENESIWSMTSPLHQWYAWWEQLVGSWTHTNMGTTGASLISLVSLTPSSHGRPVWDEGVMTLRMITGPCSYVPDPLGQFTQCEDRMSHRAVRMQEAAQNSCMSITGYRTALSTWCADRRSVVMHRADMVQQRLKFKSASKWNAIIDPVDAGVSLCIPHTMYTEGSMDWSARAREDTKWCVSQRYRDGRAWSRGLNAMLRPWMLLAEHMVERMNGSTSSQHSTWVGPTWPRHVHLSSNTDGVDALKDTPVLTHTLLKNMWRYVHRFIYGDPSQWDHLPMVVRMTRFLRFLVLTQWKGVRSVTTPPTGTLGRHVTWDWVKSQSDQWAAVGSSASFAFRWTLGDDTTEWDWNAYGPTAFRLLERHTTRWQSLPMGAET
jgi:hypothetical protein